MKRLFLILNMIFLLSLCCINSTERENISVNIKVVNKTKVEKFKYEGYLYLSEIKLTNNSNQTIELWGMSCSWENNFIFNSNLITFYGPGCNKNILWRFKLKPGEIKNYNGYLQVKDIVRLRKLKDLRLGYILITEDINFSFRAYFKILETARKDRSRIVWSNTPIVFNW